MLSPKKRKRLSKFISLLLRHSPELAGLQLDREGFVHLEDLIKGIRSLRGWHWVERKHIEEVVNLDPRGRFQIKGDRIRAAYGHSIEVDLGYKPEKPPQLLYHATARKNLESIMKEGLKPMGRRFVHLAVDQETAIEIGRRYDSQPALLIVHAGKAFSKGIFFTRASEKIFLAETVPPEFIEKSG